jgi:hypothetical protein
MLANMDWHKISASEIKNSTFRPGSQIWKIELSSAIRTHQCCHHQPSVSTVARAPGVLVPQYSGSERPWGSCNAADPLPAHGDAPGSQVCVRRDRCPLHRRAPLGVARLHVLPCLHSLEQGSALHRSPQAHPRGPVCEGAPPTRRAPTSRSFGRPAPFVCSSQGQRPTHSLKGSVSEAPAHVSVLLGGACGGGGSTACVYRWQEQQPGKTWEGQCPSTGRRTLSDFSAH